MTRIPTGPHWPGHSPTRETNESSSGVSPVPSECGLEPNGDDRPNPMVGFLRVYAEEEVKFQSAARRTSNLTTGQRSGGFSNARATRDETFIDHGI